MIYLYAFIEWGNFLANLGFNAGDGFRFVMFPEAFTAGVQTIDQTSNVDIAGVYAFRVDGNLIEDRNGKYTKETSNFATHYRNQQLCNTLVHISTRIGHSLVYCMKTWIGGYQCLEIIAIANGLH